MNKEWADKWVAALRSGEYKQGRHKLKSQSPEDGTPRFCCLGVLCDLVVSERPDVVWVEPADGQYAILCVDGTAHEGPDERRSDNHVPAVLRNILGMVGVGDGSCHVPISGYRVPATLLTILNDKYGYSFDRIADVIEKQWEGL